MRGEQHYVYHGESAWLVMTREWKQGKLCRALAVKLYRSIAELRASYLCGCVLLLFRRKGAPGYDRRSEWSRGMLVERGWVCICAVAEGEQEVDVEITVGDLKNESHHKRRASMWWAWR